MSLNLRQPSYSPEGLRDQLLSSQESDYVRIIATWLQRSKDLTSAATPSGNKVVDALTAAAVAYAARNRKQEIPAWTDGHEVEQFWFSGPSWALPTCLVNTPGDFMAKGLIVEKQSLVSV
jgi:hypothetical protein